MKIVVAGAGSVGRYMAEQLAAADNAVTVIDTQQALVQRLSAETAHIEWVAGDACELDVLRRHATGADVIAAVTGDDEDNLVVSLLAKQELGIPRVVARVNNPRNEWMFNDTWGVDLSVSTPHLLTGLVQEAVTVGSLVRLLNLTGNAQLFEVTLTATSAAADRRIGELGMPRDSTIVAVVRGGTVVVPSGDLPLRAGDEVLVLVTGDEAVVRTCLAG